MDLLKKRYWLLGGVAVALFAPQGLASMATSLSMDGHVGAEVAAFPTTGGSVASGSLSLSSVPIGATIVSATVYGNNWFATSTPSLTFAGNSLGSVSAFASDTTAGGLLSAYRWDVTSLVTGNGTYAATATGLNLTYGLAMVVVFSDPSLPMGRVVVNDGAVQLSDTYNGPDTESTALAGFGAGSGRLWIYTQADNNGGIGQTNETIDLNGTVVGGPIDDNIGPNASLFSLPVTNVAGTNTAQIYSPSDWFGWHVAVLEGPAVAAVPEPVTMFSAFLGIGSLGAYIRKRMKKQAAV